VWRAQLSGSGDAPGPLKSCVPRDDPRGLGEGGLRLGEVPKEPSTSRPRPTSRCAFPPRRRSKTTENEVARSPSWPVYSRQQARRCRRLHPHRDGRDAAVVEDGTVMGLRYRRTRAAARTVSRSANSSTGTGPQGPRDGNRRGLGPSTGKADNQGVRDGRPDASRHAGLGARRKEVWRVPKPMTGGFTRGSQGPAKVSRTRVRPDRGTGSTRGRHETRPARTRSRSALSFELELRRRHTSAPDMLQTSRRIRSRAKILEGGGARRLGREGAARRRLTGRCPRSRLPGALLWARTQRHGRHRWPQGCASTDKVRHVRAESILPRAQSVGGDELRVL